MLERARKRVLVVEDDRAVAEAVRSVIEDDGFAPVLAHDLGQARDLVKGEGPFDVYLVDINLGAESGLDLVPELLGDDRVASRIVVTTALGSLDAAAEAIRRGADDFLEKPFEIDDLVARLRGRDALPPLRSKSPGMKATIARVLELLQSNLPLLFVGERGVGREVTARWLHRLGPRRGPFVPGGSPRDPLFGLEGAGTFYVPELLDLDERQQKRLLAALESAGERWSGTRIVASTSHDVAAAVAKGRVLRGLAPHFKPGTVRFPPLRERREDLPALARWIARSEGAEALPPEVLDKLATRAWPGNLPEFLTAVREAVRATTVERQR